uniref:Uncharacterized protein n=1 Tax=Arundo donax TaxID=35708 RepID=A0A0A9BEI9_ARUDO
MDSFWGNILPFFSLSLFWFRISGMVDLSPSLVVFNTNARL